MIKLCVFSDSHGYALHMLRAVQAQSPDQVFFLGDGDGDLKKVRKSFPDLPVLAVRGNCDRFSRAPLVLRTEIAGKQIFAVHGHEYRVKSESSFITLCYAAAEANADLVLFGHTHRAFQEERMGLHLLNPGSIGMGRLSYGVVTIDGSTIETAIVFPEQAD